MLPTPIQLRAVRLRDLRRKRRPPRTVMPRRVTTRRLTTRRSSRGYPWICLKIFDCEVKNDYGILAVCGKRIYATLKAPEIRLQSWLSIV
jgi:hypothetical protein